MEVEPGEAETAGEEGEVVDVEVLVETHGVVGELGVVVLPFDELVYEVEGGDAGQEEEQGEGTRGCFGESLLHGFHFLVHLHRDLFGPVVLVGEGEAGGC